MLGNLSVSDLRVDSTFFNKIYTTKEIKKHIFLAVDFSLLFYEILVGTYCG